MIYFIRKIFRRISRKRFSGFAVTAVQGIQKVDTVSKNPSVLSNIIKSYMEK